ncbi:hypothetical protein OC861_000757, partial [Tilletia horrida]
DKRTATLTLQKIVDPNAAYGLSTSLEKQRTMVVKIVDPTPAGAVFSTQGPPATRIYGTMPPQTQGEQGDQPNTGVTVLSINLDASTLSSASAPVTISVLWQPQWDDLSSADSALPKQVDLSDWTVTSHN